MQILHQTGAIMLPASIRYLAFLVTVLCAVGVAPAQQTQHVHARDSLNLAGTWQFGLDPNREGERDNWFARSFPRQVRLPGTLDENGIGTPARDTTTQHLNRPRSYMGAAWFARDVVIPAVWKGRRIELVLERSKPARVWLDDDFAGENRELFTPQRYDLSTIAKPGRHRLTIVVDNDTALVPVAGSHAYSEDTQTNWNGILGPIRLVASHRSYMRDVRITPDVRAGRALVRIAITGGNTAAQPLRIALFARSWNSRTVHRVPAQSYALAIGTRDTTVELTYDMGAGVQQWSAWSPALYRLGIILAGSSGVLDMRVVDFGMREFRTRGTQFTINGRTTFLRGKHDGAVFPLTGHPPTDTAGWMRAFRIAKAYGINHYRFHSWTPPEAAFAAADISGVYLQPELPIWWGFRADDSAQVAFMMRQARRILDEYGNHPSFVMFALGNEIGQPRDTLQRMIASLRAYDARPLYAQGSNNRFWDPAYAQGDDYWTTVRTTKERADHSSDVRLSFGFVDAAEGGIINALYPDPSRTYQQAIRESPVPVIGHEIGEYQVYPSFAELPKYTGVLKPWNLEVFRRRLAERGMLDQAPRFAAASGALALLGYRAEIETALRTRGFGGFQLLDLQDYPGQGTALVGMLDAFMESKGLVTPAQFRAFNDDVVPLLVMKRYTWTYGEMFRGTVEIANYGPAALRHAVSWQLRSADRVMARGRFDAAEIPQGALTTIGEIVVKLQGTKARAMDLSIALEGTTRANTYRIWVYPPAHEWQLPRGVVETHKLDDSTFDQLQRGARVILFPDSADVAARSVGGQFNAEFWNYGMFLGISKQAKRPVSHGTMGLLMNPGHAALRDFPTSFHSDWQWWSIVKPSRPIVLDETPAGYRPIIQVIDNIDRNHKLGLVFEYRVGAGRLLVCAADLPAIDTPEARQLRASLLRYAASSDFVPATPIAASELRELLYGSAASARVPR